jgi:L-asparagine oxygenase
VQRLVVEFNLPESNRIGWQEKANQIRFPNPQDERDVHNFTQLAAGLATTWLPTEVREAIINLGTDDHSVALVIRNLPVEDNLPPIPMDGYRPPEKESVVSETVLLGIAAVYGVPFTYKQEKNGRMPAEVVPISGHESTQSNASRQDLHPHSDDQFLGSQYLPETLFLYGLVSSEAETIIYPAEDIVAALRPATLEELTKPNFQIKAPASFNFGGYEIWTPPRPLLRVVGESWHLGSSTRPATRAITAPAVEAYQEFLEVLDHLRGYRVIVGAGVLLGFNNLRALHARTAFEGPRWLQRCYARKSVSALQEATKSAACSYAFDAGLLIH